MIELVSITQQKGDGEALLLPLMHAHAGGERRKMRVWGERGEAKPLLMTEMISVAKRREERERERTSGGREKVKERVREQNSGGR